MLSHIMDLLLLLLMMKIYRYHAVATI